MEFGKCTYQEIKEYAEAGAIAILPTGCTEQQGPHLPVDFDTWFAHEVCRKASDKAYRDTSVRSLVLPALPFGPTPEHRGLGAGFIDLPQPLHEAVMVEVLRSLADQGFRRFFLWRGCGQHDLEEAVQEFQTSREEELHILQPDPPYFEIWKRIDTPREPGGHAGSFTTSIALYLRPDEVRMEKIQDPRNTEPAWGEPGLDFSEHSQTGVIGDPTTASSELGKRLWDEIINDVALMIKEFHDRT